MELDRMYEMSRSFDRFLAEVGVKSFGLLSEVHGRDDLEALASSFGISGLLHDVESIQNGTAAKDMPMAEPQLEAFRERSGAIVPVYVCARAYGRFIASFKWCLEDEGWTGDGTGEPLMRLYIETVNVSPRYFKAAAVWTEKAESIRGLSPSGKAASFFALRRDSTAILLDEKQANARREIWNERIMNIELGELQIIEAMLACGGALKHGLCYEENGLFKAVCLRDGGFRDAFSSLALKGFVLRHRGEDGNPVLALTQKGREAGTLLREYRENI